MGRFVDSWRGLYEIEKETDRREERDEKRQFRIQFYIVSFGSMGALEWSNVFK